MIKVCSTCNREYESASSSAVNCLLHRDKKRSESKLGDKNPMWRGDKATYAAIHLWVSTNKKKPKRCQSCKKIPTTKRTLDLANISQEYKRDLSDWEWLCRKCHMTKDGRLEKFLEISRSKGERRKLCLSAPSADKRKKLRLSPTKRELYALKISRLS